MITSIGYVNNEDNLKTEVLKSFEYYNERENYIYIYTILNIEMININNIKESDFVLLLIRVDDNNDVKYRILRKNKNIDLLDNDFNNYLNIYKDEEDFILNNKNNIFIKSKIKEINSIYLDNLLVS